MKSTVMTGVISVAGLFVLRMMQLGATEHQSIGWWVIEMARWGIIVWSVATLARTVDRMQRQLAEHKARLATIAADATLARLQLDVVALDDYADAV